MRLTELETLKSPLPPAAVCLGTFDGVHLGHQALLDATAQTAARQQLLPCAYTFDVPPAAVLCKKEASVLTPIEEKAALMARFGVDTVIYSHFDSRVAARSAESFFVDLLLGMLNARHVVIGFHYHFGQKARGDAALMREYCARHGIGITVVPPVLTADGELISSSAIRESLLAGDRLRAEMMLNRPLSPREEALLGGNDNE
ncbi:MAG: FAD synthetase family protein [Clostridia bacterium]|nr:FAD synthetase family protein [Clostridia bacterium]